MTQTLTHILVSLGTYETIMVCLGIVLVTLFAARLYNAHLVRVAKKRAEQIAEVNRAAEQKVVQNHVKAALKRMTPDMNFFMRAAQRAPAKNAIRPS